MRIFSTVHAGSKIKGNAWMKYSFYLPQYKLAKYLTKVRQKEDEIHHRCSNNSNNQEISVIIVQLE